MIGITLLVLTVASSLLALVSTVEAFSPIATTTASLPRNCYHSYYSSATTSKITIAIMSPNNNYHHHHHHSGVAFGSLRDLVESSSGRKNDDNTEDKSNSSINSNYRYGADNFNNLLNFSRSKFADTKLRISQKNPSRSGWSGEGDDDEDDDEKGLHNDRLSTFSFATNTPKSQSQGGDASTAGRGDYYDDHDDDDLDKILLEENPPNSDDVSDHDLEQEATSASGAAVQREKYILAKEGEGDYAADNFNSMVGTFYSKQKFPSRTKVVVSDDTDEKGLHSDRLSTFSFSSTNTLSFATQAPNSLSEGGDVKDESGMRLDKHEFDLGEDTTPRISTGIDDDAMFLADDFNSMVGTFYSKKKFPSREKGKFMDDMDEKGLHSDRLSTFSFSSTQPILKPTFPPSINDVVAVSDEILSSRSDNRSTAPPLNSLPSIPSSQPTRHVNAINKNDSGPSSFNAANHNDRLGTFSFASTDPHSGSTSGKGTSASSPLASASDSKITPPSSRPKESKDSNQALQTSLPQKGSLSSIASSVSIKSRNDRIKDIKDATDPKILHPDGMNVPRLNSKGDVMTLSSTGGRLNIFQRIDNVKQNRDVSEDAASSVAGDNSKGRGDCFIGFDLGTSGARMSIVEKRLLSSSSSTSGDAHQWKYVELVTEALAWSDKMQYDDANAWRAAIHTLLSRVRGDEVMTKVKSICVSGTSASCLLLNRCSLDVARSARMYNYDVLSSSESADDNSPARKVMKLIDRYVPDKHTARASTGSLAKLLLWNEVKPLIDIEGEVKEVFCHQADYISMSLMWEGLDNDEKKCRVVSDWHNCLKLGFDVQHLEFPSWMYKLLEEGANIPDPDSILPSKVISPGEPFGTLSPVVASMYGLPGNVAIVGGTTDSNAAFFASAGTHPEYGTAVTSLGSTMAIKMLSKNFVEDASRGVYSHRFPIFGNNCDGERVDEVAWLTGGASNVGCAILRQEDFSNEELRTLSEEIDPNSDCSYKYYPLTKQGERFPVADSTKQPVLTPKPDSRKDYLHGILQGIGDVEREGYLVLGELGADPERPKSVLTAGGGAANNMWMSMRERRLQEICGDDVQVRRASNTEASYGAALLAAASFERIASPASRNGDAQENYVN